MESFSLTASRPTDLLMRVFFLNVVPGYDLLMRVFDLNVIPGYDPESKNEILNRKRDPESSSGRPNGLRSVQDDLWSVQNYYSLTQSNILFNDIPTYDLLIRVFDFNVVSGYDLLMRIFDLNVIVGLTRNLRMRSRIRSGMTSSKKIPFSLEKRCLFDKCHWLVKLTHNVRFLKANGGAK